MPKFSVIVPVYNVEKYIKKCVESILNQTYKDFEVIFVDDYSPDNSIEIVKNYANNDTRIKIIRHQINKRQGGARNTALKVAQGKYIVCLDSDDWMEPNCLSVLNAEFKLRKTNSIWFNCRKYYDNSRTFQKEPMYNENEGYRVLTPANIAAYSDFTWIKAYTRESIQKYNIEWPEGITFEDGEFYFKYFTLNPKTYVIKDCLINYRHREGSTVRESDKGNIRLNDLYDVLRHLRAFWTELGVYDEYKLTMIKLIQNRSRMCLSHNYSNENKQLTYNFINEMNYPYDFSYQSPEYSKNTPPVSVVIPFYNVESYISDCLESIINQTYKNLEIICVDDCGQDNSINIVKEYAKKDDRIKIISHEINKGLGGARNTGLKYANGEYIFFIDSDDWIEPRTVKTVIPHFLKNGYNSVWFKAQYWLDYAKKAAPMSFCSYFMNMPEQELFINEENIHNFPLITWNKAYKTSFLKQNNLFWRENCIYEDVEFYFKMFTKSPRVFLVDDFLYYYRQRGTSIMNSAYSNAEKVKFIYFVVSKVYQYYKESNLFDKYKHTYLKYVNDTLNMYKNSPVDSKLTEAKINFLKEINFPDDYM